jgi:hypothetical protein
MRVIPTTEDIQDAKGYPPQRILSEREQSLLDIKKLSHICGNKKLWHEVMPTGRVVYRPDGTYSDWVEWLDLPPGERQKEIRLTAEYLARKKGWIKAARKMRMPGGWMLSEAFEQVPGYSPGYLGNPITPMASPHKMRKWGWAVWHRARQILRPYGWAPSRQALEAALISHAGGAIGKIAVRVAAASLPALFGGGLACDAFRGHNKPSSLVGLKRSRSTLINARGWGQMRKRWAHDEEVARCISNMVRHHGYSIPTAEELVVNTLFCGYPLLDEEGTVRTPLTGGRLGERICIDHDHGFPSTTRSIRMSRPPRWEVTKIRVYTNNNPACTDYHTEGGPRAAVSAWRRQIDVYKQRVASAKRLESLINRSDGAVTIVFFAASLAAGNCAYGTANWAKKQGYKNAIPLAEVIKDNRYETRRVVDYVARTY